MSAPHPSLAWSPATRRTAAAAAVYAIAAGAVTLAGWLYGVHRLTDWLDGGISMKANPALGAIILGTALLVASLAPTWRPVVWLLSAPAAILGALTLAEHVFGVDFGIDTLIFDEPPGLAATTAPGRMGPPAAAAFLLLGTALILVPSTRARRLAARLALATLSVAALSLVGYLYGVSAFYGIARTTGISMQMATVIAALAVGVMAVVPEHGMVAVLRREDPGGAMFRRLLFPLLGASILLGWLRLVGEDVGLFDTAFGTAARTLVEMVLLAALLWSTANVLTRQARAIRESEARERTARLDAEAANRLKDQFLATISHELRAPLNAILGWLHLLKKDTANPEMVTAGLEVIERNARVQSKLIADLLDVSRIVSGKLRLEMQRVDLPAVVGAAADAIAPMAVAKQILIERATDVGALSVQGDPARLQQIVGNLLSNAVKFTPSGGRVEVALDRGVSRVEIRIRDTGQGIRPEFLPHVFDRFRQEDATASRAHGGLGLGLSIVKQLVDLHGGTVDVTSPGEGKGATFTVRLPLAPGDDVPPAPERVALPSLEGLHVLVVDDEQDGRHVLARLLEECGARVTAVASARAALEAIRSEAPDLLLSDLAMPEGDGYGLLEEVRLRGYDLPAIAVTAFARPEDRERAAGVGYQAHVAKPIEPAQLFEAVSSLVEGLRGKHGERGTQDPSHVRG
jgi:signal transduction histidine kinase/ActR/RegA family two-component response regulator